MCADLCHLEEEIHKLEGIGVDLLHFDLMDGHFVPNMPMGLGVLSALRGRTPLPFDVHLMVENNDWFISEVAHIGAEQIAVHAESAVHLDRSLSIIRSHDILAGVALNPATPLTALEYVLDRLDYVLLMTVNPGFAGQKLVDSTLRKIADCRAFLDERGVEARIAVDGNVSFEHTPAMVEGGADILVAGTSSLYHKDGTLADNMRQLRQAVRAGLNAREREPAATGEDTGAPAVEEAG